jgi:hypothetical protein
MLPGITIELFLNDEDYNQVKFLFDTDSDPDFTILFENRISADSVHLTVYFNSSIALWGLAKRVEMWNVHNKKMEELTSKQ